MYECRCDERLKPEGEESTCLAHKPFFEEFFSKKKEIFAAKEGRGLE
jgi:hypothetical protein